MTDNFKHIELEAKILPFRRKFDPEDKMLHWKVKLTNTKTNVSVALKYSEGMAYFIRQDKLNSHKSLTIFGVITKRLKNELISCHAIKDYTTERVLFVGGVKPFSVKQPKIKDIIHSLYTDSFSIEQSFKEWCEEFGFNSDSRKIYKLYKNCLKSYRKLLKLGLDRRELEEIFKDY